MKKRIIFLIAAIIALAMIITSCSLPDNSTAGVNGADSKKDSNGSSSGDLDFIKNFFENSDDILSFDLVNRIITGKLTELEIDFDDEDFPIAYKDGIFNCDNFYLFLEDDMLIGVNEYCNEGYYDNYGWHFYEDGPQYSYSAEAYTFEDFIYESMGELDIETMNEILTVLDIESLLVKKNFTISGNKYTLKKDVLIEEYIKYCEEIAEIVDEELPENFYEEILNIFENIEFAFVKNGNYLSSVSLSYEGEVEQTKISVEYKIGFNSSCMPTSLDYYITTEYSYGDEYMMSFEADLSYNSNGDLSGVDASFEYEMDYDRYVSAYHNNMLDNDNGYYEYSYDYYGNVTGYRYYTYVPVRQVLNMDLSIDYSKLTAKNGEFFNFKYNTYYDFDSKNLAGYADAVGMTVAELTEYLDNNNETITATVTMDSSAKNATILMTYDNGYEIDEITGSVRFSTSFYKTISDGVIDAKNEAKNKYN